VSAVLAADVGAHCLDTVVLLTSEIVTNAVLHASGCVRLRVWLNPAWVRVEVADSSPVPPTLRNYGPEAATGRGMRLVSTLTTRWGVDPDPDGKSVWFEVAVSATSAAAEVSFTFDVDAVGML